MSKEKRRIPKLRFPGFTEDWEQREFSDIFSEVKSGLSRMLSNDDIGLPVVRANNINDGQLNLVDDIKYWYKNDPQGANTNNYLIEQGDILINFINSEAKMGTAAYVTRRPERDTIYTTNILRCKVNDEYNPYFIYSLTFLNSYKNYIASITKPAVNQASFTTVDFKKYSIKIPTVREQNQIADLIETFNKLITLHQRKLDNLKLKKKALLQKLFPKNGERYPELRFPGFTDAWEQCKLSDVLVERNEQQVETREYPLMSFVQGLGVTPKGERYDRSFLVLDQSKKYKRTELGDFIYSSNNLETGSIGINKTGKAVISPVYSIFQGVSIGDSQFIGIMSLLPRFIAKMIRFRQGVVYGQWRIHETDFLEISVLIPSVEERTKITQLILRIEEIITLHQRKLDHLKLQKKALLQQMFV